MNWFVHFQGFSSGFAILICVYYIYSWSYWEHSFSGWRVEVWESVLGLWNNKVPIFEAWLFLLPPQKKSTVVFSNVFAKWIRFENILYSFWWSYIWDRLTFPRLSISVVIYLHIPEVQKNSMECCKAQVHNSHFKVVFITTFLIYYK